MRHAEDIINIDTTFSNLQLCSSPLNSSIDAKCVVEFGDAEDYLSLLVLLNAHANQ